MSSRSRKRSEDPFSGVSNRHSGEDDDLSDVGCHGSDTGNRAHAKAPLVLA